MSCNVIISPVIERVLLIVNVREFPTLESSQFSASACRHVFQEPDHSSFGVASLVMGDCVFIVKFRHMFIERSQLTGHKSNGKDFPRLANFLIFLLQLPMNQLWTHSILVWRLTKLSIVIEFPQVLFYLLFMSINDLVVLSNILFFCFWVNLLNMEKWTS